MVHTQNKKMVPAHLEYLSLLKDGEENRLRLGNKVLWLYFLQISLKMLSFELEYSDRCIYDYLLIHDGSRPTSPAVGPYCGTEKVADFTSTGNFVLVEFHSDLVWELPGFVISYTFAR